MQRPKQRCVQRLSRDYLRHTQGTLSNSGTCLTGGAILLLIGVAKMQWGLLWPTHLVISDSTSAQGILTQQQGAKLICTAISTDSHWALLVYVWSAKTTYFTYVVLPFWFVYFNDCRLHIVPDISDSYAGSPLRSPLSREDGTGCPPNHQKKIKGPDNPTRQLLPIMSTKCCSGDGEGRKDKGGGRSKTKLCVTKLYVQDGV